MLRLMQRTWYEMYLQKKQLTYQFIQKYLLFMIFFFLVSNTAYKSCVNMNWYSCKALLWLTLRLYHDSLSYQNEFDFIRKMKLLLSLEALRLRLLRAHSEKPFFPVTMSQWVLWVTRTNQRGMKSNPEMLSKMPLAIQLEFFIVLTMIHLSDTS